MVKKSHLLKDRLESLDVDKSRCPVARLKSEMDEETAQVLDTLLARGTASLAGIHREVRAEGYKIAKSSLSDHRHGRCRCNV